MYNNIDFMIFSLLSTKNLHSPFSLFYICMMYCMYINKTHKRKFIKFISLMIITKTIFSLINATFVVKI